jgi:hypothetical protein
MRISCVENATLLVPKRQPAIITIYIQYLPLHFGSIVWPWQLHLYDRRSIILLAACPEIFTSENNS